MRGGEAASDRPWRLRASVKEATDGDGAIDEGVEGIEGGAAMDEGETRILRGEDDRARGAPMVADAVVEKATPFAFVEKTASIDFEVGALDAVLGLEGEGLRAGVADARALTYSASSSSELISMLGRGELATGRDLLAGDRPVRVDLTGDGGAA